eukprot:1150113-Pelagomonas_calceolata.AAC.5
MHPPTKQGHFALISTFHSARHHNRQSTFQMNKQGSAATWQRSPSHPLVKLVVDDRPQLSSQVQAQQVLCAGGEEQGGCVDAGLELRMRQEGAQLHAGGLVGHGAGSLGQGLDDGHEDTAWWRQCVRMCVYVCACALSNIEPHGQAQGTLAQGAHKQVGQPLAKACLLKALSVQKWGKAEAYQDAGACKACACACVVRVCARMCTVGLARALLLVCKRSMHAAEASACFQVADSA